MRANTSVKTAARPRNVPAMPGAPSGSRHSMSASITAASGSASPRSSAA